MAAINITRVQLTDTFNTWRTRFNSSLDAIQNITSIVDTDTGNISITGNTTLGNSINDVTTVAGAITVSGLSQFNGNVKLSENSTLTSAADLIIDPVGNANFNNKRIVNVANGVGLRDVATIGNINELLYSPIGEIAIGTETLQVSIDPRNLALGNFSLSSNTFGEFNTAIGENSLKNATTIVAGFENQVNGSGYTPGTYNNVPLVYFSGTPVAENGTYPIVNITVGSNGQIQTLTGSNIVDSGSRFVGTDTVMTVLPESVGGTGSGFRVEVGTIFTSSDNTSIGFNSLSNLKHGDDNVAVGFESLLSTVETSNNTAIGSRSMRLAISSEDNVAVGFETLYNANTGGNNTAVGYISQKANYSGSSNTSIGFNSLSDNVRGSSNTSIGSDNLSEITTAVAAVNILTAGSGYVNGTYNNVQLIYLGGTPVLEGGLYPTANIVVSSGAVTSVTIVSGGSRFLDTTTTFTVARSSLGGGTGTSFTASIAARNTTITALSSSFTAGSAYTPGYYPSVQLIRLSGTTLPASTILPIANITVGLTGVITEVELVYGGYGIVDTGTVFTVNSASVGGTGSGFSIATQSVTNVSSNNTSVGKDSLRNTKLSLNNTSIGRDSLRYSIGLFNTSVGESSAQGNISDISLNTGSSNVSIGYTALNFNTSGNENVAVGRSALNDNTTGNQNVAVGNRALSKNISKTGMVAVGAESLKNYNSIASNGRHTAVGYRSLMNLTSNSDSTAVGYQSLLSSIDGVANTAVGSMSLSSVIDGDNNVAVGYNSGLMITTGNSNTAIGTDALAAVTNGDSNVAVGRSALAVSTGGANTAIGRDSMLAHTIGNDNVCVGRSSGSLLTTSANNTIIGRHSGFAGLNDHIIISSGTTEKLRYNASGVKFQTQPAPAAQNTTSTLTVAQLNTKIITSNAAVTLTLPTGTDLETITTSMAIDTAFEVTFISTAGGTTIAANTGVTIVGSSTIASGSSGTLRIRKTAANTFVAYRIS